MKTTSLVCALLLAAAPLSAQGAYLGVQLDPENASDTASATGALIAEVTTPSAASLMGLQAGDLVTAVGDETISSGEALVRAMQHHLPGELVTLKVQRDGQTLDLMGILGRRPVAQMAATPPAFGQAWPRGEAWQQDFPMPSFDGDFQQELDRIQQEMNQLRKQWSQGGPGHGQWLQVPMPDMPDMPSMPMMPELNFQFNGHDLLSQPGQVKVDEHTSVQLRYPADTPPAEQERLREEAIKTYGEGVEVTFEGTGRSIMIQRQSGGTAVEAPQPPQPPKAPDSLPQQGRRDF